MSEWERILNREIAPGDVIKAPDGDASGGVISIAEGPGGDLLVEIDIHHPGNGGDNVITGGTYAIPADGTTERQR